MGDNTEVIFSNNSDEKVSIVIKQKAFMITTHFSMKDGEQYIAELSKDGNYNKAIAIVIHNRLYHAYGSECPLLEDIISCEDIVFTDYIFAIVTTDKKLQQIFDQTDKSLQIRQRFGMAFKAYTDILCQQLADAMQPMLENYNRVVKSIDFSPLQKIQELMNKMRPAWINAMDGITKTTQMIANAVQPFQQIIVSISNTISKIEIPTISQEKKELWQKSYKEWGEIGWSVLPNAPFNFFNEFPDSVKTANKLAMQFCNTESINEVFQILVNQDLNKSDLKSAIFCYNNKQYKACALMVFSLIDSKMIKLQPKKQRRKVGLGAAKKLNEELNETHFLMEALYQINLLTCLETYFADGNNFVREPDIINRNFVDHGMNVRAVRKRDCIQLFLALNNLIEFLKYL